MVEQKKSIDRIKHAGRKNVKGSDHSIHKSQSVDDDFREDTVAEKNRIWQIQRKSIGITYGKHPDK